MTRQRPEHAPTGRGKLCGKCGVARAAHVERDRPRNADRIIGIDGEGKGRRPHRYTYLAAGDADGQHWDVANPKGLSTVQCLDLILSLPTRALCIGFAFNYDLTKILADVPNDHLWRLFHEKSRELVLPDGRTIYKCVRWQGYRLNYQNRRFTVSRKGHSTTVWDFFRFYQSSFVKALTDWRIAEPAELERMQRMKGARATFDTIADAEIQAYCREECTYLAKLGHSLLDAHEETGLTLKTYNGPGSSASVLLTRMGIADKRGEHPAAMTVPIASAFFGGRFELSMMGPVAGPVYAADLTNAYPYAATGLPCLVHGRWRHVESPGRAELAAAELALVHWTGGAERAAWGCLPVRASSGSILFPLAGDGGWTWRDEYLAALDLGAHYRASDAWLYRTRCRCPPPFAELADVYRQRCRLGRNGPGRVLKLAGNSCYGKVAQSLGTNPPFQSWIMAGNITSSTRAELLRALGRARSGWDVLMMATDGIYSRRPLALRSPRDTGTGDVVGPDGKPEKALGAWETKVIPGGIFCVRPGIYFPLDPTDTGEVKARGLGKKVLAEKSGEIVAAFDAGAEHVELGGMVRFVGAKSALHRHADGTVNRSDDYGEWVEHGVKLSFTPAPKRRTRLPDGRLVPWARAAWQSFPYQAAEPSPEAAHLTIADEQLMEQPDGDFDRG